MGFTFYCLIVPTVIVLGAVPLLTALINFIVSCL